MFTIFVKNIIMIKKKTSGRPKKKDADKVKVVSAYLTKAEELKVKRGYGSITKAIRAEVLPKC